MSNLSNVRYAYVNDIEFVGTIAPNDRDGFLTFKPLDENVMKETLKVVTDQTFKGYFPLNGRGNVPEKAIGKSHREALSLYIDAQEAKVSSIVDDLNALTSIEDAVRYVSKLNFSDDGDTSAFEAVEQFLEQN